MPSFAPKPMKGTLPQGWETKGDWRRDAFQFPTPQLRAASSLAPSPPQPPQEMVTPPSLAFRRQLLPKPAQPGNNKRKTFHKPEPRNLGKEPRLVTGEEGHTPLDLSILPPSTPTGPAGTQQLGNKGASSASRRDPGGLGVRVGSRGPGESWGGGLPHSFRNADWRTATGIWILRILITWGPVATPTCLGAHAPAGWKRGSKPRPRRALSALGEKLLSAATSQLPGGSLGGKSPTLGLQISKERSDHEKQAPESCAWQAGLGNRSLDAISRKFSREVTTTSPVRAACVSPGREVWQGGGPEWRPGARRTEGGARASLSHFLGWVVPLSQEAGRKTLLGTASDQEGEQGAYDQR